MDLRQFSNTPTPFESHGHERRTSISSMSSAQSGYSQQYSHAGQQQQQQQQQQQGTRFAQSRYFGQPPMPGQQMPQGQQTHVPQNNQNSWMQQGVLNVAPWIEQQQQVSQSTTSIENQSFVNSYGNNLNGQAPPLQAQFLGHHQQMNTQSLQASFDSASSRPSPTSSSVMPSSGAATQAHNQGPMPTHHFEGSSNDKNDQLSTLQHHNDSNDNDANNSNDDDDDELIPTAIVIKNIPFAIKKEQLLEVMTKLNLPLPYAFNYHFDNGVFRGLAFANFTSTDETTTVVTQLNGREIGGRKLRVEYKKMLPLAERERIEREKREKRGQLEEQHRSTSSASLASMISISSAPAGGASKESQTPVSASTPVQPSVAPPQAQQASTQQLPPQPLQQQHTGSERYYAPIPFVNNLPLPPSQVDFNDPETLEFYSQLLFFKDDRERQYVEIAYPSTLSQTHKRTVSILVQFLGLVESYENNLILIKRRTVIHDPSPLLRSQSHSAIPLLSQQQVGQQSQRFRNQQVQQQSTSRIPPNFSLGGLSQSNNSSFSTAALLRNNPTPTRGGMPLYPTNQNQQFYQGQPPQSAPAASSQQGGVSSQPGTPGLDAMSRFNLQPQNQWDEQQVQVQQQYVPPSTGNSQNGDDQLNDGLNALNLGLDNGSNIWGPRSMQPTA